MSNILTLNFPPFGRKPPWRRGGFLRYVSGCAVRTRGCGVRSPADCGLQVSRVVSNGVESINYKVVNVHSTWYENRVVALIVLLVAY